MRRPRVPSWASRIRRAATSGNPRGGAAPLALAWRTVREARNDRVLGMAAEAAFWALLSLPPLALALLGLVGFVGDLLGPVTIRQIRGDVLNAAGQVLTPNAMEGVVRPLVDRMLSQGHGELVSFGFLVAFWSGSAAMSRYITTITIAYDMDDLRDLWKTRLLAFVLNLGAIAAGAVLLPVLVVGPDLLIRLAPGSVTPATATFLHGAYWPAAGILSVFALATLYHVGVPVRTPWHRDLPGAVLAMALWVGGSFALRTYLTSSLRETEYGPLGAPIAALLFLYVAALAVLIGAELNSEIDDLWPVESTAAARERSRGHAAAELRARLEKTEGGTGGES